MKMSERAKQFSPFASLRGFGSVIEEERKIRAEKPELSDYESEIISDTLSKTEKGTIIKITYYKDGFLISAEGIVTSIDKTRRILKVIKEEIFFAEIVKMEIVE